MKLLSGKQKGISMKPYIMNLLLDSMPRVSDKIQVNCDMDKELGIKKTPQSLATEEHKRQVGYLKNTYKRMYKEKHGIDYKFTNKDNGKINAILKLIDVNEAEGTLLALFASNDQFVFEQCRHSIAVWHSKLNDFRAILAGTQPRQTDIRDSLDRKPAKHAAFSGRSRAI
jgi:hypothetical protein